MIRALVIDDEPLSRRRVRRLLESEADISVVGECEDGEGALRTIRELGPDLVFLDVQMPEKSGLDVLRELDTDRLPFVIFVTAFDHYALEAFEVHALDYLVKPVQRERFAAALERARAALRTESELADYRQRIERMRGEEPGEVRRVDRVLVKTRGRTLWRPAAEIDWIHAEGNYARLHFGKESYLIRETMNEIEHRLDPARFIRVHRSAIVNVDRVREVFPVSKGDYAILLEDGVTRVPLSRSYRARLEFLLGEM